MTLWFLIGIFIGAAGGLAAGANIQRQYMVGRFNKILDDLQDEYKHLFPAPKSEPRRFGSAEDY